MNWIQIAKENGGILHVELGGNYAVAEMRFVDKIVKGAICKTQSEAFDSLNSELANDAADEMVEAGVC